MVGGCCDGIFIRSCLQFLVSGEVEHHQFTDNSAARQLISRQGVGRIRHLSGKLLWMQSKVMDGSVVIHQVPTLWNFSDVGTKSLPRARLLFLLCGIGMIDAETAEPLGMDEYNNVTEQETNKKEITKLAKMMRKITLLLTVQGLGPAVAESAEVNEQCPGVNFDAVERQEHFGMWLVIFILLVLWFLFAYMAWFAWRKMQDSFNTYAQKLDKAEWDIHYCWTQVADEDNYIAQQAARIDGFHNQFMMIDGRLTEANNEASMSHDYMVGLHYSVVELGGFLRFPFGVEPSDLISMGNQERANLVAFNAMGARQYLNLVRQRAYVEGGQTTDVQMSGNQNTEETAESENATDDEMTAARPLQDPSMTDLMEELKIEFRLAQQRNEPNDAVRFQHMMMQMLNDIKNGVTNEMVENYNRRIADLFFEMSETARSQNRLQSSLYYGRRCAHFRGDA